MRSEEEIRKKLQWILDDDSNNGEHWETMNFAAKTTLEWVLEEDRE